MTETNEISPQFRETFRSAVAVFQNWADGYEKTQAIFEGGYIDIESVFGAAEHVTGEVDEDCYQIASGWAKKFSGGPEGLDHNCNGPTDKSYVAVGQCFTRLCVARRDFLANREKNDE